ncbi:MAG TPA: hypothetical protein VLL08_03065 [Kineosporiaceae bacterium]|nr:hypothetical protein [Kineosporiaceae bacterium]
MSNRRTTAHWQADLALAQLTSRTGPATPPPSPLAVEDVTAHLRKCGVVVLHAAQMPTPRDGRQVVVVFLDGDLDQVDVARQSAKRLPGVLDVMFSGYNQAVMYVIASPAYSDYPATAPHPHPGAPMNSALRKRPGRGI